MIPEGYIKNLDTLKAVFANEDAALVECTDKATGKPVIALCGIYFDGENYEISPFAKMFDGNPYEELDPPG